MFLIMHGRTDLTLEDLPDIPITPQGTDFLALRDAAQKVGMDVEIRRYKPEQIDALPLPAIGQFRSGISTLTPDHFDVVFKIDKEFVYSLDGTTAALNKLPRSLIGQKWSGYALIRKPSLRSFLRTWSPLLLPLAICLAVECVFLAAWYRRKDPNTPAHIHKSPAGATLMNKTFLIFAAAFWIPLIAMGEETNVSPWRDPSCGGANVLYCYLRVQGVKLNYADLVASQKDTVSSKGDTAVAVADVAAIYGRPLEVHSLSMEDLRACAKPVIVHMDGETPEAGAFLLLLSIAKDKVDFINGPSASMHSLSLEDFRRNWSGIALIPATPFKRNLILSGSGFLGAVLLWEIVSRARSAKR
jgi:ABC-type bacteriocin/lantibiotic exporter with double-glycine peptidase domain